VLARRLEAWSITMLGEESEPAYNRILLSKLLAGTCGPPELELRPRAWYEAHGLRLLAGTPAQTLRPADQRVIDARGEAHDYDALVLATGSRPFLPPLPGGDQAHVFTFRTRADVEALSALARPGRPAVVLGGGLLGLEAAAGLLARGARVTVVELADRVMPQQLDPAGARQLEVGLERLGIRLRTGRAAAAIGEREVELDDGERLPAELVVVAAGIRAEVTLARQAGIAVERGVLVDDAMRTSAPGVWAVGECAEHRGTVHGLWAPVAEQARVAGAGVVGDPAAFHAGPAATTLKVAGIDLFAGGRTEAAAGEHEISFTDTRRGVHRKLVLSAERLVGAVLVGDTAAARQLSELLRTGAAVPAELLRTGSRFDAPTASPEAVVCSCNSVTRAALDAAIVTGDLRTLAAVGRSTRAGTGCGGCAGELEAILAEHRSSARNERGTGAKPRSATIAA
jgi:ferredoxin-nitrate reductase